MRRKVAVSQGDTRFTKRDATYEGQSNRVGLCAPREDLCGSALERRRCRQGCDSQKRKTQAKNCRQGFRGEHLLRRVQGVWWEPREKYTSLEGNVFWAGVLIKGWRHSGDPDSSAPRILMIGRNQRMLKIVPERAAAKGLPVKSRPWGYLVKFGMGAPTYLPCSEIHRVANWEPSSCEMTESEPERIALERGFDKSTAWIHSKFSAWENFDTFQEVRGVMICGYHQ